jgi:hypothetical protein
MTLQQFEQYLNLDKFISDRCHTLYENSVDLIEYDDSFHRIIKILGVEAFTAEGWDHIENFTLGEEGTKNNPLCWDGETKEPLYWDLESLYNFLIKDNYIKTWEAPTEK